MNPSFPLPLNLTDGGLRGDTRLFRLTSPFIYLSSRGQITVPLGFTTDGASIPRVFWSLLGPFGPYFEAAVIHDFLYSPWSDGFSRAEADSIFKEAMFNLGLDWPRREAIYRAVRLFGGRLFRGL